MLFIDEKSLLKAEVMELISRMLKPPSASR